MHADPPPRTASRRAAAVIAALVATLLTAALPACSSETTGGSASAVDEDGLPTSGTDASATSSADATTEDPVPSDGGDVTAAADPTALTFGGTTQIQSGMSVQALEGTGLVGEPSYSSSCDSYPLSGADEVVVLTKNGVVRAVSSMYTTGRASPAVHTLEGVHAGDTAADVRRAYGDRSVSLQKGQFDSYLIVQDDDGRAVKFTLGGAGDGAEVVGIGGGSAEFLDGTEPCLG